MFIKQKMILWLMTICLISFAFVAAVNAEGVKVIINTGVSSGSVDAETVKKIYSGYMTKWPDNQQVVLAVMEDSQTHAELLKTYVGKSESQFKTTWKKMVFTGKGSYPKQCDSQDSLVEFVAKTPGAIGYVDGAASPQGVNVIQP